MSSKKIVIATLVLAGGLAAGAAQAHERDTVQWSVTIGTPAGVPVVSAPVYRAPVVVVPVGRGYAAGPAGYYRQPTRWDRDGDGIPNHRDALYNPRWDRDGDGIPNRRDALYNPRWDRDGDGIPNRQDRFDNRRFDRDHRDGREWHR